MVNPENKDLHYSFERTMGKALIPMVFALFIAGCGNLYETPEEVYFIKQGEHKSRIDGAVLGNGLRSLKSSIFRFTVRFDSSAIYDIGKADQGDMNTLFGFSDCNGLHIKNSTRIGWSYNPESKKVGLFAYVYRDSKRIIQKIQDAEIGATYICELRLTDENYEFSINNNESAKIRRGNTCDRGFYYLIYPYFGGTQPAPHNVRIFIRELYD